MNQKKSQSPIDRIWNLFASVTLAIILIAALAITSIVGTVIEQNAGYAKNIEVISRLLPDAIAPSAAPVVYRVLEAMGFMDMYHSWWFIALLAMFSLNLLVCSVDRLPRILKLVTDPMIPLKENVLRNLGVKRDLAVKARHEDVRDVVAATLKSAGFRPQVSKEEDGSVQIFGHKGAYSRLAVYVVHGSILLIFVGAIIGLIFGFKGGLNLPEGSSSDVVYQFGSGKEIPLGFSVKCEWYETQYYGSSFQPKLFRSQLVVLEDGQEVEGTRKWIRVNDPLVYKGVTFYQSSYGPVPNPTDGQFVFEVQYPGSGKEPATLWLRMNQPYRIPGTDIDATVLDFSPALTNDRATGKLITFDSSMLSPAARVRFTRDGQEVVRTGWIWERWPDETKANLPGGVSLIFKHYWGKQYTGLQVRKDPGVWLVYLGCTLMSLALFVAFFVSHRKIWIRVGPDRESVPLLLGATAHRNKHSFEKDVDRLVKQITSRFEGGA